MAMPSEQVFYTEQQQGGWLVATESGGAAFLAGLSNLRT